MAEQTQLDRQTPMTPSHSGMGIPRDQLRALNDPRSPQPHLPTTHSTSREEDTATLIPGEPQLLEVASSQSSILSTASPGAACRGLQLLQAMAQRYTASSLAPAE